jgi:hypothetical protein
MGARENATTPPRPRRDGLSRRRPCSRAVERCGHVKPNRRQSLLWLSSSAARQATSLFRHVELAEDPIDHLAPQRPRRHGGDAKCKPMGVVVPAVRSYERPMPLTDFFLASMQELRAAWPG